MNISADDTVMCITAFILCIIYPAAIIANMWLMRQADTETAISGRIILPSGRRYNCCRLIFFKLYTSKKFPGFITILYILTGATHLKNDYLKRRNKNIIPLDITPAGFVNYINSAVSVAGKIGFRDYFPGNIFIKQAINDLVHFLGSVPPHPGIGHNTGNHIITAVSHIGILSLIKAYVVTKLVKF